MPEIRYKRTGNRLDYEYTLASNGVTENILTRYEYYTNGRLKKVRKGNAVVAEYEYHSSGRIKIRKANNVTEKYTDSGFPTGRLSIWEDNSATPPHGLILSRANEVYRFAEGELKSFFLNGRNYKVRTTVHQPEGGSRNTLQMIFQEPDMAGFGSRKFIQAFVYDTRGQVYVVMDPNVSPVLQEKIIPKFLYMGQFYDQVTGLYYLNTRNWYDSRTGDTLYNRIRPLDYLPTRRLSIDERYRRFDGGPRSPIQAGTDFGWHAMRPGANDRFMRAIAETLIVPEEIGSRISGGGRILAGALVFAVSIPTDITLVGLIVGVPMAIWAGDQIGTGIAEIQLGKYQTSMGGRVAMMAFGDGFGGKVATGVYDIVPAFIPSAPATAVRLLGTGPRFGSGALRLTASEARFASESMELAINAIPDEVVFFNQPRLTILQGGRSAAGRAPQLSFSGLINGNTAFASGSTRVGGLTRVLGSSTSGGSSNLRILGGTPPPRPFPTIMVPETIEDGSYVYRLIRTVDGTDETVYIGITRSQHRIDAHALTKTGWQYQEILTGRLTQHEAQVLEAYLIRGHLAIHPQADLLRQFDVGTRLGVTGLQNLNRGGLHPRNWNGLARIEAILNPTGRWRFRHPHLPDLPPHPLQPLGN